MSYIGTVRHGRVALLVDVALPEGTLVRVEPLSEASRDPVYRLDDLAVDADLPADLASEHDRYIRLFH